MTSERLLRRELKRLPRQAEMLIETMAEGRRILVRKADNETDTSGLNELVSLIRTFGPAQILFVSRDTEKAGTVERISETLIRGYIGEFADPAQVGSLTNAEPWLRLCRRTYQV